MHSPAFRDPLGEEVGSRAGVRDQQVWLIAVGTGRDLSLQRLIPLAEGEARSAGEVIPAPSHRLS